MSSGLNQVIFGGNLGADAELKVLSNGTTALKVRIAVNESWKDEKGEKQERTEWVSGTLFDKTGKRASGLAPYLTKGQFIIITGSQRTNVVEKDGDKKYFTETIIRDISFGGGAKKEASDDEGIPEELR